VACGLWLSPDEQCDAAPGRHVGMCGVRTAARTHGTGSCCSCIDRSIDQSEFRNPFGLLRLHRHRVNQRNSCCGAGTSTSKAKLRECVIEPPAGPWGPAPDRLAHTCTRPGRGHPLHCTVAAAPDPARIPCSLLLLLSPAWSGL
jgi:hypothetical protein